LVDCRFHWCTDLPPSKVTSKTKAEVFGKRTPAENAIRRRP
jgi:hypothetical protein